MVKKITRYQDAFDKAYDAAIKAFSISFTKVPPARNDPTGGIYTILSSGCGGSGFVEINSIRGNSATSNQLKEWCESNRGKCYRYGKSYGGGMSMSLELAADKRISNPDPPSEAQCVQPKVNACKAFIDSIEKSGIDPSGARVRSVLD